MDLDRVDRRLLNALAIESRAPFRRLATVVGVSDQTAARRYRRLRERAGLRVLGRVNGPVVGWTDWYLRIGCVPGGATELAAALARRDDTRWIMLVSGGTEIVCALQARTEEQRDTLLLDGLPGSRRVSHLTAHALLTDYSRSPWTRLTGELTEDQNPAPVTASATAPAPISLSEDDRVLTEHLARDGRVTNSTLAAALGWHETTVRRRIQDLRRCGALTFDVDIDIRCFGMTTQTMVWASVDLASLTEVGRMLASHPEVPFVAATTGPTNLLATVVCANTTALHTYLTERAATLPGLRIVETSPLVRLVKRTGPVRAFGTH